MYKLNLLDPITGITINAEGEFWQNGQEKGYISEIDSEQEAKVVICMLLEAVPWASAELYCDKTSKSKSFSNEKAQLQYIQEKELWGKYNALPWYKKLFSTKPVLKYVKT